MSGYSIFLAIPEIKEFPSDDKSLPTLVEIIFMSLGMILSLKNDEYRNI